MVQYLSRWKSGAADVQEDEDHVPIPRLPHLATQEVKALRSWADYCILCGNGPNPAHFDERAVTRFFNRLTELEEIDRAKKDGDETKDPSKMALMTAWSMWVELFTTYLAQHRSVVARVL